MNPLDLIVQVIPTLNDDQKSAITTTEGPLLIIAGPGTGKTLTIIARTLYILLSEKALPEEIVLTTFTNKAAFELRDRINQLAKKLNYNTSLHPMKIGTIHSLCDSYINDNRSKTKLKKDYQILDELTQPFFIYENFEDIIKDKNQGKYLGKWKGKWDAINNIIPYLNKITEEFIEIDKLKGSNNNFLQLLADSYHSYVDALFKANCVDFSFLQKIFYELLLTSEVSSKIKEKLKYIMVDEYQDTNYIQEQILLKLADPENNIAVVGDEDQSLYRFRGATVRNILEFPTHFANYKKVELTINYRSHPKIIKTYNNFMNSIDWDKYRFPKMIFPIPDEKYSDYPAVFSIRTLNNERDEALRVADLISFLKSNNIIQDWSNVAILMKSVRQENSDQYINALKERNIPYFAPRAKKFFDNEEIKLLIACYALIFGFYEEELNGYYHRDYIDETIKCLGENKNDSLYNYITRRANQIINLTEGSLDFNILDYFFQLLAYEPFITYLKDENKAYNLSIFTQLISIYQSYYNISIITAENKTHIRNSLFRSFFNFLLASGINEYENPDNPVPKGYVQIMTFHQAKGLEFPVVIVDSLDKSFKVQKQVDRDLLPFSQREEFEPLDKITIFDRTRHYYVAFSRAQKILVLTANKKPVSWLTSVCEGLDQYPYIEKDLLLAQKFESKPQFIPKKSYSLTNINMYEICPQQYLFFKEYNFQPSRSAQVLFGSLVHYTIEDIHRAILDKKNFSDDDIENWLYENYTALLSKGLRPLIQTRKELALKQVLNYYHQNQDLISKIKETEVNVSIDKEDYIITGIIDLLTSQEQGLDILDFKTQKKPDWGHPLINSYEKQLCLYAYILQERYNSPINNLYIYWTAEEKRKDALMQIKYSEQKVEEAGKHFDEIVHKIREKKFEVEQSPDTEKVCKECDFRFFCSRENLIKFHPQDLDEI